MLAEKYLTSCPDSDSDETLTLVQEDLLISFTYATRITYIGIHLKILIREKKGHHPADKGCSSPFL